MDLDKFLNLVAAIFGAFGGIYVMLSIMAMSPELQELTLMKQEAVTALLPYERRRQGASRLLAFCTRRCSGDSSF